MRKRLLLAASSVMVIVLLVNGCGNGHPTELPSPGEPAEPVKPTKIPVTKEAMVMVKSHFQGDRHDQSSGFIMSPDGHILAFLPETAGLEQLEVILDDGRSLPARIINATPVTEFACLKIEATNLKTLAFCGGTAVEAGERLMAAGYSAGEFKVMGVEVMDPQYRLQLPQSRLTAVKLDTGGEPGMAGGPVANDAGEVIGVNLATIPETGESFMVPIDYPGVVIPIRIGGGRVNAHTDPDKTISIKVGQDFTIGLYYLGRLGQHWEENHDENKLFLVGESYIPDDVMNPGTGGYLYLRFKALKEGKTEVKGYLKHAGGWGCTSLEKRVFKVEID